VSKEQRPLTLALSRRERGLTGVNGGYAPTWKIELSSGFENPEIAQTGKNMQA